MTISRRKFLASIPFVPAAISTGIAEASAGTPINGLQSILPDYEVGNMYGVPYAKISTILGDVFMTGTNPDFIHCSPAAYEILTKMHSKEK